MQKLSRAMDEYMKSIAKHVAAGWESAHNGRNRTCGALVTRDLVRLVDIPNPTYGVAFGVEITVAGWEYLREMHGIERPEDEGRMTIEEAWAEISSWNRYKAVMGLDDDRLSLSEALEEAYTPDSNTPIVYVPDAGFQDRIRTYRLALDYATPEEIAFKLVDEVTEEVHHPEDEGRYTLEEALSEAYTPAVSLAAPVTPNTLFQKALEKQRKLAASAALDTGRLTMAEALSEAYTPKGQATCYHGRGLADTCDDCTDTRPKLPKRVPGATNPPAMGKCPHGYTIRDTCPFCDESQGAPEDISRLLDRIYDRIAGKAYDTFLLDGQAPGPDRFGFGTPTSGQMFNGVPVPPDISASDPSGTVYQAWVRGVQAAQAAAQRNVSAALPPAGDPSYQCTVCKWRFTTETSLRRHSEGHSK